MLIQYLCVLYMYNIIIRGCTNSKLHLYKKPRKKLTNSNRYITETMMIRLRCIILYQYLYIQENIEEGQNVFMTKV